MIEVERDGAIARVWLNRIDARNALSAALIGALSDSFEELGRDDNVRVIVLGGRGPDFCAGADLQEMRAAGELPAEENLAAARLLEQLFHRVRFCPRPVVARVHGAAVGGGAGLLAACDIAIAADSATLGFSEVRLGLLPAVISPYVVARIGERRAREYFLTGERFDGRRAEEIGLIDQTVPVADLDDAIGRKLALLLQGSPEAQTRIKELLEMVTSRPLADAAGQTPHHIARARASADGREGVAAFFEKRKPSWVR